MTNLQKGTGEVTGNVAHDAVDAGNPVGIGVNVAAFKADPPEVSNDGDRTRLIGTPEGIGYFLGGHPNIITREFVTTSSSSFAIIDAVGAAEHVVITEIGAFLDGDVSVAVDVRIGFGTSAVPTVPTNGNSVVGMALSHPGISAGSGKVRGNGSGIVAVGAADEELRITNATPTGGSLRVVVTYYISPEIT